jgi:ABC-type branched-subunit amino acid transport system substrate-binding protein
VSVKPLMRALVLASVLGAATAAQAAGAPLVIGQTADFSGPQAAAVKETTAAARAYFDRVNKAGGVNGRPIVLESVDDGFDPKKTVENAKKLIAEKQPLALMLSRGTANAEALIPVTQQYHVAVVAPVGGSELMHRPANHFLFNLRPPHKYEAEKAVAQLAAQGLQHIAVAYVDDAMGNDAVKGALQGLKSAGLQPVALAKIPRGEPKVEEAADALAKAHPDAVVGLCIPKSCAALVHAMRERNSFAQFVSMSNTSSSGYVKDLGKDARGVIVTQVYPYPFNDSTGAAKEFHHLAAEYDLANSYSAMEGFIAAKVVTEALRRAGPNPTPQSVIAVLEKLDYDVGNFAINFAGNGRSGNDFMEMTMISRGGRFIR